MTVKDEATLCERVAVTVTFVRTDGAKVRQISAVPRCVFVRFTRTHVSPAPATLVTVVLVPETGASAATNASTNSLLESVEKAAVETVALAVPWSLDTVWSTATAARAEAVTNRNAIEAATVNKRRFRITYSS
jgi:hypothetical protein